MEKDMQKTNVNQLINKEEEVKSELLMKQLRWVQAKEAQIKQELRNIIYKLDRKI